MSKNNLNQRNKIEDFLFKSKFDYGNQPINRLKKVEIIQNKQELLKKLKLKIENLKDCELKKMLTKLYLVMVTKKVL